MFWPAAACIDASLQVRCAQISVGSVRLVLVVPPTRTLSQPAAYVQHTTAHSVHTWPLSQWAGRGRGGGLVSGEHADRLAEVTGVGHAALSFFTSLYSSFAFFQYLCVSFLNGAIFSTLVLSPQSSLRTFGFAWCRMVLCTTNSHKSFLLAYFLTSR